THFSISAPASTTAGSVFSITITALTSSNNTATTYLGTVHFSSTDSQSVLPANYIFTAADAGVHTFANGVTLKTAGSKSVTATDMTNSSIAGKQSGIVVNPAATNHVTVSRFPSPTIAGVAQSFRVTAQDMFGNTTPGFTDMVSFTSTDSHALLPGKYTFTSLDAGIHNFSATLVTTGSQSITVQALTPNGLLDPNVASGTQSGIVVNPAAASHLQVAGFPLSVLAGTAHSFNVTALDPYENIATGYRGTVTFSSSDTHAMLPA